MSPITFLTGFTFGMILPTFGIMGTLIWKDWRASRNPSPPPPPPPPALTEVVERLRRDVSALATAVAATTPPEHAATG